MKERLPIAISVAALVVAVLGSTGLGEAAQNGVTAGASKAKRATGLGAEKSSARRGPRGPRGYRGYRGYRGLRGFQGPPGDKGDKGDAGPSDGFFASSETPVNISGQSPASATVVLSAPYPAGTFLLMAKVKVEGTADTTVSCHIWGAGSSVGGSRLGSGAGSSQVATISMLAWASVVPQNMQIRCWRTGLVQAQVTGVALTGIKVASLNAPG